MEKQGIYAYGVVSKSPLKMDNVFVVHYQDVTLVGKMIDIADFQKGLHEALENPKTMETVLTEHQSVLDRLMRETTVVPFQFGTILKDKKRTIDHLKSSYTKYKKLLKKFKDREEWGVRVFATLQTNQKNIQSSSSGTAYLLKKKQEEEEEKATNEKLASFSGEILNSLKEFTFEYKLTKSSQRFSEKGELLISAFAFLLDKAKVKKFTQKLAEIEKKYQERGLRLIRSGPWPAYNFVS